jgi:hypothetical protein
LLVLLAFAWPAGLAAQTADSVESGERPSSSIPLDVRVRAGADYFANFLQAPEGEPRENVTAATGEVKIVRPFESGSYLFVSAGGIAYSTFDPSSNVLGGFGWSAWPHLLQAYGGYRAHTPRLDVGDTLGFANIVYLHASYEVRPAPFIQFAALVDHYDEHHGQRAERDNTFLDVGGAVRYRGLDKLFSPELGVSFGSLDVATDTEDYDQRTLWVTLRSVPAPTLLLRLRYRNRQREYSIGDVAAPNFGREDQRHELALSTALSLRHDLRWMVYYSLQLATSTKASRNFQTHYVSTGLEYRFGGGRR